MKTRLLLSISVLYLSVYVTYAQFVPFSFAQLTDIHISPNNDNALNDLRNSVAELNQNDTIAFVVISGDVTDAGERGSMLRAKQVLDSLRVPYYVTSGNHETKWSESACMDFSDVFGSDKFAFEYNNCLFFGFPSGPIIKMADGHVSPQDILWIQSLLDKRAKGKYIFPITHYPLQNGDVDNWYDVTDILRQYNVQAVLGGHYHRNLLYNCDGIADVLVRSNLRAEQPKGGYTIVSVGTDSIRWQEKPIDRPAISWLALPLEQKIYPDRDLSIRPDFSVNQQYPFVTELWQVQLGAELLAAPIVFDNFLYVGDDLGFFYCIDAINGNIVWKYHTAGRIVSTAALADSRVVFGSADGAIYCLNSNDGNLCWKYQTEKAVMGCPIIYEGVVYIAGSDGCMRAISLISGNEIWVFDQLKGYVETRPCIYDGKIFFGAWDRHMYALNLSDGSLVWKWNNGHHSDKFSPAACWPVATNGKIFFTAPDRVFTCLDALTGEVLWRTNEHVVRETIGISEDGKKIFSRCMWDRVVALDATSNQPQTLWNIDAQYGYDHNPSMLIEKDGIVVFGTKNGLIFGINAINGNILWKHKIGNSVINTVFMTSGKDIFITSANGTVTRLSTK